MNNESKVYVFPGLNNNSKVVVEIFFNKNDKTVHILDRKEICETSLTSIITQSFQTQILRKLQLFDNIDNFIWYLYHTDNTVSIYKDNDFEFVTNFSNEQLYKPFLKIMSDLNEIRKSIVINFNYDNPSILEDISVENEEFSTEISEELKDFTDVNHENPEIISYIPKKIMANFGIYLKVI